MRILRFHQKREMDFTKSAKSLTETTTETTAENNDLTGHFLPRNSQPSNGQDAFSSEESHEETDCESMDL